ncbi:MAG: hypothetical protein AAFP97_12195 [Pseudomonadota bacterium]
MFDFLEDLAELWKKSAPVLLALFTFLWICFLLTIDLMEAAFHSFPKFWPSGETEPPSVVIHSDQDPSACREIDGIRICERDILVGDD